MNNTSAMPRLTKSQANLLSSYKPPTDDYGRPFCEQCRIVMPDLKSWLLHSKGLHIKQFKELFTGQLHLQKILDENIRKIHFDDDEEDDDAKVLPVNSNSRATGGLFRFQEPMSPAPMDVKIVDQPKLQLVEYLLEQAKKSMEPAEFFAAVDILKEKFMSQEKLQ